LIKIRPFFKNSDADTAVVSGNPSITKSGENISPPPRPTMVRMKEEQKITGSSRVKDMLPKYSQKD